MLFFYKRNFHIDSVWGYINIITLCNFYLVRKILVSFYKYKWMWESHKYSVIIGEINENMFPLEMEYL